MPSTDMQTAGTSRDSGAVASALTALQAAPRVKTLLQEIETVFKKGGLDIPTLNIFGLTFPNVPWISAHLPLIAANAYQPEVYCIIPRADGTHLKHSVPPVLEVTQNICRYLRSHPELQPKVEEALALQLFLAAGATYPLGMPAIEINSESSSGCLLIPGCGLAALRNVACCRKARAERKESNHPSIVLNDAHPFVANVAERFVSYFADSRLTFQRGDLGLVVPLAGTNSVHISFVDSASPESFRGLLTNLRKYVHADHIISLITAKMDYSIDSLLTEAAYRRNGAELLRATYSHLVRDGRDVDFCDLSLKDAISLATFCPGNVPVCSSMWYSWPAA
jgi:hypothetical protein